MKTLTFTETISAPAHVVWSAMLGDETYREWTNQFDGESYFVGSWGAGDQIRFIGQDEEGNRGGMFGYITVNRPDEYVEIEYLGQILDGADDTDSDFAKSIAGTHESYTFDEKDGVTTLVVELESLDAFAVMFDEQWPAALAKLKEIAERA